jgi:hypothetical protein
VHWAETDPQARYPYPRWKALSPDGTIEFRILVLSNRVCACPYHLQWLSVDGPRRFGRSGSEWFDSLDQAQAAALASHSSAAALERGTGLRAWRRWVRWRRDRLTPKMLYRCGVNPFLSPRNIGWCHGGTATIATHRQGRA